MNTSVQCLPERALVHYQLIVTPEILAQKIKAMKIKKSPRVDGILPELLIKTVEQISVPLARVFNLSLRDGLVPF